MDTGVPGPSAAVRGIHAENEGTRGTGRGKGRGSRRGRGRGRERGRGRGRDRSSRRSLESVADSNGIGKHLACTYNTVRAQHYIQHTYACSVG